MDAKILLVDDSSTDCMIIGNMLKEYTVFTASNGLEAMKKLEEIKDIDLIILDLNMPHMDGFEVLAALQHCDPHAKIDVIILTNADEIESEIRGLKMGAIDYIRKPVNIQALKMRMDIHLRLRDKQKEIEKDNQRLDSMLLEKNKQIKATRDITIYALLGLLEVRNIESHNHTVRTKEMMKVLCEHLSPKKEFCDLLTPEYIYELSATTPLHDIGKVGIPDSILLKPGKLTSEEFDEMKKHVQYGVDALKNELHIHEVVPSFIKTALEIIGSHHEKYDGSGYPNGLIGQDIPFPGRLMAIIDVYDALMSKRIYKPAYEHSVTIQYMQEQRSKHFDPILLDAFLEIQDPVLHIMNRYTQDIKRVE
jgi:putative two-component system response regulator